MAGTTGLEPATSAVTGQRSNQLNYVPLQNLRAPNRRHNDPARNSPRTQASRREQANKVYPLTSHTANNESTTNMMSRTFRVELTVRQRGTQSPFASALEPMADHLWRVTSENPLKRFLVGRDDHELALCCSIPRHCRDSARWRHQTQPSLPEFAPSRPPRQHGRSV